MWRGSGDGQPQEGEHGGALDDREEEELAQSLMATIDGAKGLEHCAVVRRTQWRDELVTGGAVVMTLPIEITAAVRKQNKERKEETVGSIAIRRGGQAASGAPAAA
jgi:hypothetical protein